jgi:hypothetical protein
MNGVPALRSRASLAIVGLFALSMAARAAAPLATISIANPEGELVQFLPASPTAFAVVVPLTQVDLVDAGTGAVEPLVTNFFGRQFSPLGMDFIMDLDGVPTVFDVRTGTAIRQFTLDTGGATIDEDSLRWIVDGSIVVVAAFVGEGDSDASPGRWVVQAFDADTGDGRYDVTPPEPFGLGDLGLVRRATPDAPAELVVADGRPVAPAHLDDEELALTFKVFDLQTGAFLRAFPGPSRFGDREDNPEIFRLVGGELVVGIPCDESLASGDRGRVQLLDGTTGALRREWGDKCEFGTAVAIAPHDVIVVGQPRDEGRDRGSVVVFERDADEPIAVFKPPSRTDIYFGAPLAALEKRVLIGSDQVYDDYDTGVAYLYDLSLCEAGECTDDVQVTPAPVGALSRLLITCPALTDRGGHCEAAAYAEDGHTPVTRVVRRRRKPNRPTVLTLAPNRVGRRLLGQSPDGTLAVTVRARVVRRGKLLAEVARDAYFGRR